MSTDTRLNELERLINTYHHRRKSANTSQESEAHYVKEMLRAKKDDNLSAIQRNQSLARGVTDERKWWDREANKVGRQVDGLIDELKKIEFSSLQKRRFDALIDDYENREDREKKERKKKAAAKAKREQEERERARELERKARQARELEKERQRQENREAFKRIGVPIILGIVAILIAYLFWLSTL